MARRSFGQVGNAQLLVARGRLSGAPRAPIHLNPPYTTLTLSGLMWNTCRHDASGVVRVYTNESFCGVSVCARATCLRAVFGDTKTELECNYACIDHLAKGGKGGRAATSW